MTSGARTIGRPPKVDDRGTVTRERLLDAAAAACVEHGFDSASVQDIARRAGVSAPAIYHYFGGREALLVAAGRRALDAIGPAGDRPSASRVARAFLADDFAPTRRLMAELHLAGRRNAAVAALLADWHAEHAREWARLAGGRHPEATVTAFFALLLGVCHVDALDDLGADRADVRRRIEAAADALFPTGGTR